MKPSEYDKAISAYKTYISDFFYISDLRSGHFCDLPIMYYCGRQTAWDATFSQ